MLQNYFKLAYRNLLRQKSYTSINLAGLTLGISCCLLIFIYVHFEMSYDQHHKKSERIYRLVSDREVGESVEQMANAPLPAGPLMGDYFPEVENAGRLLRATNGATVEQGDRKFTESEFYFADPEIFQVFSFEFLSGNSEAALEGGKDEVIISKKTAEKYFGDKDPIGELLSARLLGMQVDLVVTGVVQDLPANSHFHADFLVPFESSLNGWNSYQAEWSTGMLGAWTYMLLKPGASPTDVVEKFSAFKTLYLPENLQESISFDLQALSDIHLRSHRIAELGGNGNIIYIYILLSVAVLVLLVACVNFVNLATVLVMRRGKEVGIRKVMGAEKNAIVSSFLVEASLLCLIAIAASLFVVWLTLPAFSAWVGKPIVLGALMSWEMVASILGIWLLVGGLAGLYPAFFMSRFQTVSILKGQLPLQGNRGFSFSNGLLAFQFVTSMVMVIAFWTMLDQLSFIRDKSLGFNRDELIVINSENEASFQLLKQSLEANVAIEGATVTSRVPGGRHLASSMVQAEGQDESAGFLMDYLKVEKDFLSVMQLELLSGRDFRDTDKNAVIINESAAKQLGWGGDAVGRHVINKHRGVDAKLEVVGVVQDIHFESLHEQVKPLILQSGIEDGSRILVRLKEGGIGSGIAALETSWKSLNANSLLGFYFLDNDLQQIYSQEKKLTEVIQLLSLLAIGVLGIGLFGLLAFQIEQRMREFGIRKVLGAGWLDIIQLMMKRLTMIIGLSSVIAIALGWGIMNRWLEGFAYRVDLSLESIGAGLGVVFVIVLCVVLYHTGNANRQNPVDTLRT